MNDADDKKEGRLVLFSFYAFDADKRSCNSCHCGCRTDQL